jgi:choline dehydrogenase-like flavoprotein
MIHALKPMSIEKSYDYIIIGSGPGGATLAKELSRKTKSILIIEYGPKFTKTGAIRVAPIFFNKEKMYPKTDSGIWVGRARILGGSSYVAMGNAVTPPRKIFREWEIDLSEELESARRDLRVNPMPSHFMGEGTRRINEAAKSLGWEMKPTSKCVDFTKCKNCGQCMFGCPTGAKWTALEFIDEATSNGAELLLDTEVMEVLHEKGRVTGIRANNKGNTFQIDGKNIILSTGALETPRILQNSGIPEAGKGLAMDVYQPAYGYTEDVGMKNEIILGTYLEQLIEEKEFFAAPYMYTPLYLVKDIEGYAPEKLNLFNQMKIVFKSRKIKANRLIGMMTKIRDEMNGEVSNDGIIHKPLTKKDKEKLEEAYDINRRILIAAGANPERIYQGSYESGHPCCTASIGKVVNEHQETRIKGLFVSDASIFPSPLGMPTILTIVAFSKRLAKYLLS